MLEDIDQPLFYKILNQVSDPVFILSTDFRFIWANEAYSKYMRMDLNKILSEKLEVVIPPEYAPTLKNNFKKLTPNRPSFDNIYPSALPDGTIIIERWHNEGVFSNEGILNYYYCIATLKEKEDDSEETIDKTDLVSSTLIRSALLGIVVAIEGKISYINQKTWEIFGITVGDIFEDMKLTDFFKKVLPGEQGKLLKQINNKSIVNYEIPFSDTDNHERWVSIIRKKHSFKDVSTDLILIEDITERKLNEIETKAAKDRLAEVMRIAKVGYWERDFKNNCWLWSDEIYEQYGIKKGTVITEDVLASCMKNESMDRRRQHLIDIENLNRDSYSYRVEYQIPLEDGSTKWISGESFYEKAVNGNPAHHYGWTQEITERKNIEKVLRKAKEKAEESERLKTAFLANMSHEIRTPLNAILGFSDLMTRNPTAEEQNKFKQIIKQSSTLLLNVIDDILDISTIESGNLDLNIEQIDVDELFETINTIFSDHISENITLLVEKTKNNLSVQADRERLKQVLINLISNAYKYTSKGYIKISCKTNKEKKQAMFSVQDTGKGIEPAKQKRIFERFYQTDSFSKGTGLGLAITQSLIEQMDGSISVRSELGKGSEFTFTLPLI